jgi:hypothetical protein
MEGTRVSRPLSRSASAFGDWCFFYQVELLGIGNARDRPDPQISRAGPTQAYSGCARDA